MARINSIPGRSLLETIPLSDLSDVTITSPADNDLLAYDNASSEWINQTPAEAGLDSRYLQILNDLSDLNDAATARVNLGVEIGVDVQAYDATLQSISALGTAADKMLYTTGVDTWAEADITSAGLALLDDATAADQRTTLGLVAGGTGDIWVEKAGDTMTGELTIAKSQGNVFIKDMSGIPDSGGYSDMGIIMDGGGSYESGIFTEVDGQILTLAHETYQVTQRDTTVTGGIFRFDARAGLPFFSVKRVPIGTYYGEVSPLQITSSGDILLGEGWANDSNSGSANVHVKSRSASVAVMLLQGASGQSTNFFTIQDSNSFDVLSISSKGRMDGYSDDPSDNVVANFSKSGVSNPFLQVQNFNNDNVAGSTFRATFARGLRATPAAVQNGDRLGSFLFAGYDGSNYQNPNAVFSKVDGAVSSGTVPGKLSFETGSSFGTRIERISIASNGNIIVNDTGVDADFTIEGDNDTNLFFVDAGNDRVGIGLNNPSAKFQVAGNVVIGAGAAGVDYTLTFDGETNDGLITWMEDEDRLDIADTTKIGGASDYTQIDNTGDVLFAGGGGLEFGEIYLYNNSTADTVSSGSYVQLTRFDTNGVSNGSCVPDHTNDHITIGKAGMYLITMSVSFSGSGSVTWDGGVFKNNGATQLTNLQTSRKLGASGDVGSASISGIADLAANDTVEVWFQQNEGVNKDITVVDCTLSVVQVGGT